MKNKYRAVKTEVDGIRFDSKREANRYRMLRSLELDGVIKDLKRQVKFTLIPAQRNDKGKLVHRECYYKADFTYTDSEGNYIVEDAKGMKTPAYNIKKKLMYLNFGIEVKEV